MEFNDFVNAVLHGGVLTLSIFIILLCLSVVTWGIIIGKVIQLRREDQNNGKFVSSFNQEASLRKLLVTNRERGPVDYYLGIVFEELMH